MSSSGTATSRGPSMTSQISLFTSPQFSLWGAFLSAWLWPHGPQATSGPCSFFWWHLKTLYSLRLRDLGAGAYLWSGGWKLFFLGQMLSLSETGLPPASLQSQCLREMVLQRKITELLPERCSMDAGQPEIIRSSLYYLIFYFCASTFPVCTMKRLR